MVLDVPPVQLKYQLTTVNETLILRSTVRALTTKQSLIPTTTCLNIIHADERLWTHRSPRSLCAAPAPCVPWLIPEISVERLPALSFRLKAVVGTWTSPSRSSVTISIL